MADLNAVLIAALAAFALTLIGTAMVRRMLSARAILDQPNNRSSHVEPTPRGGGIAVIASLMLVGGGIAFQTGSGALVAVLGLAAVLAAISWIDDLHTLSPIPRLAAQVIAVGLGLNALPDGGLIFQGLLPGWLDTLIAGLMWIWFINLYNFMDGIDGIAAIETATIGVGLILVGSLTGGLMGGATLGAALGFLVWNRPPARIFLGDVGSVPLGFILGWLLLDLAVNGYWAAAVLLALYYLADATITLIKRLFRGEAVWQAHRSHFYQQAIRALEGDGPTSRSRAHWHIDAVIVLCNMVLLGCAAATLAYPGWTPAALLIGALAVAVLLWYFASRKAN